MLVSLQYEVSSTLILTTHTEGRAILMLNSWVLPDDTHLASLSEWFSRRQNDNTQTPCLFVSEVTFDDKSLCKSFRMNACAPESWLNRLCVFVLLDRSNRCKFAADFKRIINTAHCTGKEWRHIREKMIPKQRVLQFASATVEMNLLMLVIGPDKKGNFHRMCKLVYNSCIQSCSRVNTSRGDLLRQLWNMNMRAVVMVFGGSMEGGRDSPVSPATSPPNFLTLCNTQRCRFITASILSRAALKLSIQIMITGG